MKDNLTIVARRWCRATASRRAKRLSITPLFSDDYHQEVLAKWRAARKRRAPRYKLAFGLTFLAAGLNF